MMFGLHWFVFVLVVLYLFVLSVNLCVLNTLMDASRVT